MSVLSLWELLGFMIAQGPSPLGPIWMHFSFSYKNIFLDKTPVPGITLSYCSSSYAQIINQLKMKDFVLNIFSVWSQEQRDWRSNFSWWYDGGVCEVFPDSTDVWKTAFLILCFIFSCSVQWIFTVWAKSLFMTDTNNSNVLHIPTSFSHWQHSPLQEYFAHYQLD